MLLVSPVAMMVSHGNMNYISKFSRRTGNMLNLSMATITALSPRDWDITVVNEDVEPIDFSTKYDLVGIAGHIPQYVRAVQIAEKFRKQGALVLVGGPGPSVNPERWRGVGDVLFIGEAERTYPQFVADYASDSIKPEYVESEFTDLSLCPLPDFRGYTRTHIESALSGMIQTSRGCPYDCEFCDCIVYSGRKMRYKSHDLIMKELDQLQKLGSCYVFVADDNFGLDRKRTHELLRRIRAWNQKLRRPVTFSAQISVDTASNEETLELLAEAGFLRVNIGIESPNKESLTETGKMLNVAANMKRVVRMVHEHGMTVVSGCMVGFDHDDLSCFQMQHDFFQEIGVGMLFVFPVQALDGTPLQERMKREGRFLDYVFLDNGVPRQVDGSTVHTSLNTFTITPKQLTLPQLQQGIYWLMHELFKPMVFARRHRTFFDNYRKSPKRGKLRLPRGLPELAALKTLGRVVEHLARDANNEERLAFLELLDAARASGHPQRYPMAIQGHLYAINQREMIRCVTKGMTHFPYPT